MRTFLTAMILTLGFSHAAKAGDFGLGVMIGDPTGISGKVYRSKTHAVDGAVSWALNGDYFYLHGDHLWQKSAAFKLDRTALDFFFGLGVRLAFHDSSTSKTTKNDFLLGVRGPVGLAYTFSDPRIELFGELALVMNLIKSTSVDFDGGLGARYYF